MALKDDFKAALQTGNSREALLLAMSQAIELKITTWVSPESNPTDEIAPPGERLQTKINLVEGQIEHEVGDRFIGYAPYRELRDYHQEQVGRSPELLRKNLQSLQKLFAILEALKHQQKLAGQPPNPALPPLDLAPLPPLTARGPRSQSAADEPLPPVIPSLQPAASDSNTPQPEPSSPPTSDVEIEDWEEAVALQAAPPFPPEAPLRPLESLATAPEPEAEQPPPANTVFPLEAETPAPANSEVFPAEGASNVPATALSETPAEIPPESDRDAAPSEDLEFNEEVWTDVDIEAIVRPVGFEDDGDWDGETTQSASPTADETNALFGDEEDWGDLQEPEPREITPPSDGDWGDAIDEPPRVRENINAWFADDEDWSELQEPETRQSSDTDWGGAIDESPRTREDINAWFADDDDWGDVLEPETRQTTPSSDENWGDATNTTQVQTPDNINAWFADEEDWGDVLESEPSETSPASAENWGNETLIQAPDETNASLGDEEDWGDVLEPETGQRTPASAENWGNETLIQAPDETNASLEEDWGDILEPETSQMTPSSAEEFSDEEDWEDFKEEANDAIAMPATDEDLKEEERGNAIDEARSTEPALESLEPLEAEFPLDIPSLDDWEDGENEKAWEPETEMLEAVVPSVQFNDDEWKDYTEEELDSDPSVPDLRAVYLGKRQNATEDEDWSVESSEPTTAATNPIYEADWTDDETASAARQEPELAVEEAADSTSAARRASLDDEWEDFESLDPFANPIESDSLLSEIELEEDWEDFAAEELEPYPNTSPAPENQQ